MLVVGAPLRRAGGGAESVRPSVHLSIHHQGFTGEVGTVLGGQPHGKGEEAGRKTWRRGQLLPF